jgi:hypothetical protein
VLQAWKSSDCILEEVRFVNNLVWKVWIFRKFRLPVVKHDTNRGQVSEIGVDLLDLLICIELILPYMQIFRDVNDSLF